MVYIYASWHKGENYKKSYALNKNLGGGVINTSR